VPVSFSTVPLMTRSSLTASSASVVKVSSAEAKSSVAAVFSSAACAAGWSVSTEEFNSVWLCSKIGSASVATAELESESWGVVVSSNKIMPLW
jgi:hypothetical protein